MYSTDRAVGHILFTIFTKDDVIWICFMESLIENNKFSSILLSLEDMIKLGNGLIDYTSLTDFGLKYFDKGIILCLDVMQNCHCFFDC